MVLTLLDRTISWILPGTLLGWIIWVSMAAVILYLLWALRGYNPRWTVRRWLLFAFLTNISIFTPLFFAIELKIQLSQLPSLAAALPPPTILFFLLMPMVLAGGLLGPIGAAVLGLVSGSLYALFNGGTLFTSLEFALLAVIFSGLMRQRYRSTVFRGLAQPLIAAVVISGLYPVLFFMDASVAFADAWAQRIEYAATWMPYTWLTIGVPFLLAAAIAQYIALRFPVVWSSGSSLVPAPSEGSLQAGLNSRLAPWMFAWALLVFAGTWIVSGYVAESWLTRQLDETAKAVANGVPEFQETGHLAIDRMAADERLAGENLAETHLALQQVLADNPFFHSVSLWRSMDLPVAETSEERLTADEYRALEHALRDKVPFQSYSVPPLPGEAPEVSFIATLPTDEFGRSGGVLIARARLSDNSLTANLLDQLNGLGNYRGGGALVNESGRLIYHSELEHVGDFYRGESSQAAYQNKQAGITGAREWVSYQPVSGYNWAVVTAIPLSYLTQIQVSFALPVLLIMSLLSIVSYGLLNNWVGRLATPLRNLSDHSSRIAEGNMETPLDVTGTDEVGQLKRSLENMRRNLKHRIEESAQLLTATRGMASALDMETIVVPALDAALSLGPDSVRLVLAPTAMPTELADRPLRIGRGAAADRMAALDKQVIALSAQQPEVYLANPARARLIPPDGQAPGSVFLVALTHENQHLGCLWLAYEQIHSVSPEEANFVNTLASQITLSITNARLFHEASLGRQRLEAVLAATPDPVLVTDAGNRLLLANPAADQLFGGSRVANQQPLLDELIKQSSLLAILTSVSSDILTGEVIFANLDRVYEASSAPIQLDGQRLGRICVLRDVTEHKKLNTMMSEFVSLVSHDLKNPLTLVKGYATMLGIIGDLTPQQQENLDRIKKGVDRMTVLTDNLLDVTRLEAGVALKIETVSVNKLLADIEEYLQPSARQNRLKLVFAHLTEEIRVEADKSQLRSAWQNLIENAIKYSRQGGQVYVATSLNGDQLLFSVQDNGVGIAPLDQEHVFERFYRVKAADGSTGNIKGNGLGLSIVKSVAERHGGRVWFESQLGKGSRFFLEIPARQAGK